jgi:hypothetical protein
LARDADEDSVLSEELRRPSKIVLPSEKEVAGFSQFWFVMTPDVFGDPNVVHAPACLLQCFYNPRLKGELRCHELELRSATIPWMTQAALMGPSRAIPLHTLMRNAATHCYGESMPGACTFCENPLDGSDEHILLSALGGRKRSTRVVCGDHNNAFGNTIDAALARQLAFFCNILGIRTGRGEETATLRNLTTTSGEQIDLRPGGRMFARTRIEDNPTSSNQRAIRIAVSSDERLRQLVPQYLRRYNRNASDLENVVVEERIEPGAAINFEIDLGDEQAYRCIAKMCLLLLASATGTNHVRGPDTASLRAFILDGSGDWDGLRREYQTEFPRPSEHSALPAYAHRIGVVADPAAQLAYGQIELFGIFRYTAILSEAWNGPAVGLHYGVNPVDGVGGDARIESRATSTASEIRARNAPAEQINERTRIVWPQVLQRQLDIAIRELVAESMERALGHLEDGAEITDEDRLRVAEEVSSRFVALVRNRPYREQLDLSRVLQAKEDD